RPPGAGLGVEEDDGSERRQRLRGRRGQDRRRGVRTRARAAPCQDRPAGGRVGLADKKVQATRSVRDRVALLDKEHPKLSMRKQCELLAVARSTAGYQPVAEDPEDLRIKRLLDETYLIDPCLGS